MVRISENFLGSAVEHLLDTLVKQNTVFFSREQKHPTNYVGDSVLGPDVNLGAGVKLSNLRNDGGEVHTRIDGERVATGLRKFGAILGEGCPGCNAVTNPGVVLGAGCMVMPTLQ